MYMGAGETYALFSCTFTAGVSSSYQRIGIYDTSNGAFIGYEGTTFNITTRNNGSDVSVAKASWNVDTLTGAAGSKFTSGGTPVAITLTNLNVYRIRFGWIGGAPIYFEVLSPDGEWVTFHVVRFPNSSTAPSFRNADLPITLDIQKTAAGATDLQMLTACWVGGTVSERDDLAVIAQGSQTSINNNILLENAGTGPIDCLNYNSIALQINVASGTVTAGAVTFEGTNDITGNSWVTVPLYDSSAPTTAPVSTYTIVASTNRFFEGPVKYKYLRARLSTGITGTTTGVQAYYRLSTASYFPQAAMPVVDNGGSLSVDWNGTQPVTGSGNATGALRVELANNGTGLVGLNAGSNLIGAVNLQTNTGTGWTNFNATSGDGSTALTNTAQQLKSSAGKVGGWFIYNPNSAVAYVILYNSLSANVTVGTTTPLMVLPIPPLTAANLEMVHGINFSTAISAAATSTAAGNGAPTTALDVNIFYN
jgi:hypothetical protein